MQFNKKQLNESLGDYIIDSNNNPKDMLLLIEFNLSNPKDVISIYRLQFQRILYSKESNPIIYRFYVYNDKLLD